MSGKLEMQSFSQNVVSKRFAQTSWHALHICNYLLKVIDNERADKNTIIAVTSQTRYDQETTVNRSLRYHSRLINFSR